MPEAPVAEPSFREAIAAGAATLDFSKINKPAAPPEAPAAPAPKPPEAPKPATPVAPATPKAPAIPPIKPTAPAPSPDSPAGPDDETPASIQSAQGKEDWKKLRTEAQTLRAEVAAKTAELTKLMERSSKAPPEVETLKKQLNEMSERLRIKDVESHPQFQAYFGQKTAAAIAIARSAAGVDRAEEVTRILQLPESDYRTEQLDALIEELPVSRRTRVLSALTELDRVNVERTEAINRAKRDGTTAEQQRQAEQQAHIAKATQIFDATVKEAQENLPAFQLREGDETWNAAVAERIATAKHIFSGQMPFEDMARATIWAASAPALNAMALQLSEEVKTLKAENATLRAKAPSPSGGGEAPPPEDDPNMSVTEAIRKRIAAAGDAGFPWQRR